MIGGETMDIENILNQIDTMFVSITNRRSVCGFPANYCDGYETALFQLKRFITDRLPDYNKQTLPLCELPAEDRIFEHGENIYKYNK